MGELWERIKAWAVYGFFILLVILVLGGISEVFTPGTKYTAKEIQKAKEEYLEEYLSENGEPSEMYCQGRDDVLNAVYDILDRHGIEDPAVINEIDELWDMYMD